MRTAPRLQVVENSSLTDEENLEALETEISILRQLRHPHIVTLKEVVTTPSDTYIVMELLGGGELFNRIVDDGPFPEEKAAALFSQVRPLKLGDAYVFFFLHYRSQMIANTLGKGAMAALRPPWRPSVSVLSHRRFLHACRRRRRRHRRRRRRLHHR